MDAWRWSWLWRWRRSRTGGGSVRRQLELLELVGQQLLDVVRGAEVALVAAGELHQLALQLGHASRRLHEQQPAAALGLCEQPAERRVRVPEVGHRPRADDLGVGRGGAG